QVLNLAFYPRERGPYNYDTRESSYSAGLNRDGTLRAPDTRWGGVMSSLYTNDFEAANVEYLEFWVMDPYVEDEKRNIRRDDYEPVLMFNLGNISEDILKDGRKSFENGLNGRENLNYVDTTAWGRVPVAQSFVNAFDNDIQARQSQDIGLDGLNNDDERSFFSHYLDSLMGILDPTAALYEEMLNDPSGDDYHYYRGGDYDALRLGILDRYKKFNGLEGNSPTAEQSRESYPTQSTNLPDVEDINMDNTLNESESYFQYKVSMRPEDFQVGRNFITDAMVGKNIDGDPVTWYQFKIPIYEPDKVVGSIQDFKSIRFIRMFLRGFSDEVILRFATLELVKGEWRKYNLSLLEGSEHLTTPEYTRAKFEVSAVNIEENGNRYPVNYILPPGITRTTDPTNPQMIQQNEQAIELKVTDLEDGDARASYLNRSIDMRQYKKMKMFVHAEAVDETQLRDNELRAFIRIGADYTRNYYEYEVPLKLTPHLRPPARYDQYSFADRSTVWPAENEFVVALEIFQQIKQLRNDEMRREGSEITLETFFEMMDGLNRVLVVGNPNLGNIRTIMIGIRNPSKSNNPGNDDGLPKTAIVWFNELRLTDFDESGGWAANARLNATLADLGNLSVAGSGSVPGFGSIDKKVQDRSKEEILQYDVSTSLQLGKFFPKNFGVQLPLYMGYSEVMRNPQYNPLDPDIPLQAALDNAATRAERDSILFASQDYNRRKSINFTNVRLEPGTATQRRDPKIYSIANWSVSYSFNETFARNVKTESNLNKNYNGVISYVYSSNPKPWEPLKKSKVLESPSLRLIREFNFYPKPSMIRFQTNMVRRYSELQLRNVANPAYKLEPTYNKNFNWNRNFDFRWDLTRALKLEFNSSNIARIDEPDGPIRKGELDYEQKRDSIWQNILAFGRPVQYHHSVITSYSLPLNKIPMLNWLNANAAYRIDYDWTAGPVTADTVQLGNIIQNAGNFQLNGSANLQTLYNKVGYLKKIDDKYKRAQSVSQAKPTKTVKFEADKINVKEGQPKVIIHDLMTKEVKVKFFDQNNRVMETEMAVVNERRITITAPLDVNGGRIEVEGVVEVKDNPFIFVTENFMRILMGVKTLNLNYSTDNGTLLPGFMPVPQIAGLSSNNGLLAPGLPFVMGLQNDGFGDYAAENMWLTTDSTLNQAYTISRNQGVQFRASVEPFTDLRIELNATHSMNRNQEQFYYYAGDGRFNAESQMFSGNFSMSYLSIGSAFERLPQEGEDLRSPTFEKFKNNRNVISRRLGEERLANQLPGSPVYDPITGAPVGYSSGYGPTSQEVIIPAFLAAYANKDPEQISLTAMPGVLSMLPNWRVQFSGVRNSAFVKKYFRNFNVTHSYRSTYSVGTFSTNLFYNPDEVDGLNYIRDVQENFLPEREIGAISISEQLSPLISFEAQMVNSLQARVEIKKTRNISLSLNNNQVMENRSNELVVGTGYQFQDVPITVMAGGTQRRFQSDLDLRIDLTFRDNRMIMRKLEEDLDKLTSGQQVITIKLTADYRLSNRFNLRFYYDQVINEPLVMLSYPTSNTKVGFNIRFTLTQ
ncbi:MAG: cell surface protein SprA, partial [Bacteroidales bacterium]